MLHIGLEECGTVQGSQLCRLLIAVFHDYASAEVSEELCGMGTFRCEASTISRINVLGKNIFPKKKKGGWGRQKDKTHLLTQSNILKKKKTLLFMVR